MNYKYVMTRTMGNEYEGKFYPIGIHSDKFLHSMNSSSDLIAGGQTNCIFPGTNHAGIFGGAHHLIQSNYSYIGSGSGNSIYSDYSTIAGGTGNTIPVGFPNAHIVGSGITAACSNNLHTNQLMVLGMLSAPGGTGPFLPGTLYFDPITRIVYYN